MNIELRLKNMQKKHDERQSKYGRPNSVHWLVKAWQPTKGRFKLSSGRCTLDVPSMQGQSYGWWDVCRYIGNTFVFNSYRYSATTAKHQYSIRAMLKTLGVKIDLEIECPKGLQNAYWAESAIEHDLRKAGELHALMAQPGSRKSTNAQREKTISAIEKRVAAIAKLGKIQKSLVNEMRVGEFERAAKSLAAEKERKKFQALQLMQVQSFSDVPPPGIRTDLGNAIPIKAGAQ